MAWFLYNLGRGPQWSLSMNPGTGERGGVVVVVRADVLSRLCGWRAMPVLRAAPRLQAAAPCGRMRVVSGMGGSLNLCLQSKASAGFLSGSYLSDSNRQRDELYAAHLLLTIPCDSSPPPGAPMPRWRLACHVRSSCWLRFRPSRQAPPALGASAGA